MSEWRFEDWLGVMIFTPFFILYGWLSILMVYDVYVAWRAPQKTEDEAEGGTDD